MIHRVLCLLLVPALLANQAALCCAHTHEGHADAAPHVHLPWNSHGSHGHSHSHGHDHHHGSHHHHEMEHHSHSTNDSDADCKVIPGRKGETQHDAVIDYTEATFLTHTKRIVSEHELLAMPVFELPDVIRQNTQGKRFSEPLSIAARYRCAIFLQTLSLRL